MWTRRNRWAEMSESLLEQPSDDFVIRSYASALTRCIQAHRPCSSKELSNQGPPEKASQQSAAHSRPGTRGVRHHGYVAAKERAAAELDRQQTQGRCDAACTLAAAPHSYDTADAAEPPHAAPQSATQASEPGQEHASYGCSGAHDSWDAAWAWWAPPPPPPPLPAWLFSQQGPAGHQPPAVPQPASASGAPTAAGSRSESHGTPALALAGDGSEVQAAAQAQARTFGDDALAELLTAWFRAGFLSGQHAARAAGPSTAMS